MLLLAHHDRETIVLETSDGPIEIRLSRLDSHEPRIGIDAPPSVRIIRKALLEGGRRDQMAGSEPQDEGDGEPWWHHPDDGVPFDAPQGETADTAGGDWDDDWLG